MPESKPSVLDPEACLIASVKTFKLPVPSNLQIFCNLWGFRVQSGDFTRREGLLLLGDSACVKTLSRTLNPKPRSLN